MINVRDALRPFWVNGLSDISINPALSLKAWLIEERYIVGSIANKIIEINTSDINEVVSAFASDIDRFSAASLETTPGIFNDQEIGASRAWPLIREYYAAFYAANAFIRIFGRSVSRLEQGEIRALRRVASASGMENASDISEALYLLELDVLGRRIIAKPLGRGPHEDMWTVFENTVSNLQAAVLLSSVGTTVDRQEIFQFLQVIRDIINSSTGRGNWLSTVRNNVTYRHEYGAWYPHGKGRHWQNIDAMCRLISSNPLTWYADTETKPIVRFTKGCVLIVSMLTEIIRDIARRHPTNKSFLNDRSIPILSQL